MDLVNRVGCDGGRQEQMQCKEEEVGRMWIVSSTWPWWWYREYGVVDRFVPVMAIGMKCGGHSVITSEQKAAPGAPVKVQWIHSYEFLHVSQPRRGPTLPFSLLLRTLCSSSCTQCLTHAFSFAHIYSMIYIASNLILCWSWSIWANERVVNHCQKLMLVWHWFNPRIKSLGGLGRSLSQSAGCPDAGVSLLSAGRKSSGDKTTTHMKITLHVD